MTEYTFAMANFVTLLRFGTQSGFAFIPAQ